MKALVVDVYVKNIDNSPIEEMINLLETLNIEINNVVTQNVNSINQSIYIGKGFLFTIAQYVKENNIDVLIFNNDLTPLQIRNINTVCKCDVLDRSMVIIKIFQIRANSKEAQLQVEMSALKYYSARLIDRDINYSQVTSGGAGGLQNRGSGEKEIDIRKYLIRRNIKKKEDELEKIVKHRENQRKSRDRSLPCIAIVGYTNAGKSTLLNRFIELSKTSKKDLILEENRLFATLDTTTRLIKIEKHFPFLLTDTVGFISNLPTTLIKAFRSTLEEITDADILIHVVDISSPYYEKEIEITNTTLQEIGIVNKPMIYIYNKSDKLEENFPLPYVGTDELIVSLKKDDSYEQILNLIDTKLECFYTELELFIPYENINVYYEIKNKYPILEVQENEKGYQILTRIGKPDIKKYKDYLMIKFY